MAEKKGPKQQKAEGTKDKAKGKAKEAYGAAAGDTGKRAEGQKDQAKGEVKKKTGEAREEVKKRT